MGRTEKRLVYCDSQAGILRTYHQLSYHCDIRNKCIVEILRIKKKNSCCDCADYGINGKPNGKYT